MILKMMIDYYNNYLILVLLFLFLKYYSKFKCIFNTVNYKSLIENIKIIEENLLKKCRVINKIPQYKISEQLKNGNIKIFNEIENKSVCSFILKISGIWETHNNYGLTYKFMKTN